MKAADLISLTRSRRRETILASGKKNPQEATVGKASTGGWPDARYDGLSRLRLPTESHGTLISLDFAAHRYRDAYRGSLAGEDGALADRARFNDLVGKPEILELLDKVVGRGDILWHLAGSNRRKYGLMKAGILVGLGKIRKQLRSEYRSFY